MKRASGIAGFIMRWGLSIATMFLVGCRLPNQLQVIDNKILQRIASLDRAEIELGKMLFFDSRLSRTNTISCASCHDPSQGFGDGKAFSQGVDGNALSRHTPSLYNLAWAENFFWDGRANSLEEQVQMVLTSPEEMDISMDSLVSRLNDVPAYRHLFEKVYPSKGITERTIVSALVTFTYSIVSYDSPFDRYMQGDLTALSNSAVRGMKLFEGKGGCAKCHDGPHFSDGEFHNTGVSSEDLGRYEVDRIATNREFEMTPYPFFASYKAFKTPGLRNVSLSAPYMHNGSEPTLEDVIQFYNKGGEAASSRGLARPIKKIHLTEPEIKDLVEFLKSLTAPVTIDPPNLP